MISGILQLLFTFFCFVVVICAARIRTPPLESADVPILVNNYGKKNIVKKATEEIIEHAKKGKPYVFQTVEPGSKVIGFDIILTEQQQEHMLRLERIRYSNETRSSRTRRKALRSGLFHWKNGVIPYVFDRSVEQQRYYLAKLIVRAAMNHFEEHTCIKFEEYDQTRHGPDVLIVRSGDWCSSNLGRVGGRQYLYINVDCLSSGTIIHELGHTIGWIHEHGRPDRDDYISVDWSKVSPEVRDQYQKESIWFVNTYSVPYDYKSIMHYPDTDGELKTRDPKYQGVIGQRDQLSFYDKKLANAMYNCAERCYRSGVRCQYPGFVGPECRCICLDGTESCTLGQDGKPVGDKGVPASLYPKPTFKALPTYKPYSNPYNTESCGWLYYRGRSKNVRSAKRYHVSSLSHCKLLCLEMTEATCMSFHYSPFLRSCLLSTQWEEKREFNAVSAFIYYERPKCLVEINFCGWEKVEGLFVRMHDDTSELAYDITLTECKLTCLQERNYPCNSVMYRLFPGPYGGSICVHSMASLKTSEAIEDSRINYYEARKCRPK